MKHGDFSELAENYSKYRPAYSKMIVNTATSVVKEAFHDKKISVVDAGAGTGIFSRMLATEGLNVSAVEPNKEMREHGIADSQKTEIKFYDGSAEETGLSDNCCHLVTMASSFHWPDFDKATQEFQRILKPGGYFLAIWNTRAVERDPVTADIEQYLKKLVPDMKRKSSGRSEFCDTLLTKLTNCDCFEDAIYLEGFHIEKQSHKRYIGLWKSVNDVLVQAGQERFDKFISYINDSIKNEPHINANYQTRAWLAKCK